MVNPAYVILLVFLALEAILVAVLSPKNRLKRVSFSIIVTLVLFFLVVILAHVVGFE